MPEIREKYRKTLFLRRRKVKMGEEPFPLKKQRKTRRISCLGSKKPYLISYLKKFIMQNYSETQKLRSAWLYVAMAFTFSAVVVSAYQESSLLSYSFLAIFGLLLLLFGSLLLSKLKLTFNDKGIYYRFTPFHWKTHVILWEEVEEASLNDFSALAEYGGWGVRYNFFTKTKAFVARSGCSLFLQLRNGRKRLFSIQQPEQLRPFLKRLEQEAAA